MISSSKIATSRRRSRIGRSVLRSNPVQDDPAVNASFQLLLSGSGLIFPSAVVDDSFVGSTEPPMRGSNSEMVLVVDSTTGDGCGLLNPDRTIDRT